MDNSSLVKIIIFIILFWGIRTLIYLPKEGFPQVSFNIIHIKTIYPGATAKDVELNVTNLIEKEISGLRGVDEIRSQSKNGISFIEVKIDEDLNDDDFNNIFRDIDYTVNNIENLPKNIKGIPIRVPNFGCRRRTSTWPTPIEAKVVIAKTRPDHSRIIRYSPYSPV